MTIGLVLASALAFTEPGELYLRGREGPSSGSIVAVERDGIHLIEGDDPNGPIRVVPWHEVRSVTGPHADEARPYLETGEMLWRARSRMARGDLRAAEPLFERVYAQMRDRVDKPSAIAAEGLLRCRLHRGAQTSAVEPWFTLLARVASHGSSEPGLFPTEIVDRGTGLVPSLPPIWLPSPPLESLADRDAHPAIPPGSRTAKLRDWYIHSARSELGRQTTPPQSDQADFAISLVSDIVQARAGDANERSMARNRLERRTVRAEQRWVRAWALAGLGRSLLQEAEEDDRLLGVARLLQIPAEYAEDHPYLAAVALAESAVAMAIMGYSEQAETLRRELLAHERSGVAEHWSPIRDWPIEVSSQARAVRNGDAD